eukprot:TRINITY_DN6396_c1_g2_i1.p1 TRINITY_DN6396_c1_g2~~TRINITY_DN6396_c1_g2_i1.p1  ORF type:complete len:434 (+),score=90.74 TRINITY_DN6396_c1_g2_i1:30-1304(+)
MGSACSSAPPEVEKIITEAEVMEGIEKKRIPKSQLWVFFADNAPVVPKALRLAIASNNAEALGAALKYTFDPISPEEAATHHRTAIDKNFPAISNTLNSSGKCPATVDILHEAIRKNKYDCVIQLVETNKALATATVATGDTALHIAYVIPDTRLIRQLIANGALIDAQNLAGETPLITCSLAGPESKFHVAVLLELGCSATLHQLCHAASVDQAVARLEKLLAGPAKSQLNAYDAFGRPPLLYCPRTTTPLYLEKILDAGADPNGVDGAGDTLLHKLAAPRLNGGHPRTEDLVKILLKRGASPNKQNALGKTALHVALDCPLTNADGLDPHSTFKIVQDLLEHGADVNIASSIGTPLEVWVLSGGWVLQSPPFDKSSLAQLLVLNHKASMMSIRGGSILQRIEQEDISVPMEAKQFLRDMLKA